MAQQGNFKSPSRLGALGAGAPVSSSGSVPGGKPREDGLKGVDFERRSFLGKIVGGIGAAVAISTLYPVVKYIQPGRGNFLRSGGAAGRCLCEHEYVRGRSRLCR